MPLEKGGQDFRDQVTPPTYQGVRVPWLTLAQISLDPAIPSTYFCISTITTSPHYRKTVKQLSNVGLRLANRETPLITTNNVSMWYLIGDSDKPKSRSLFGSSKGWSLRLLLANTVNDIMNEIKGLLLRRTWLTQGASGP